MAQSENEQCFYSRCSFAQAVARAVRPRTEHISRGVRTRVPSSQSSERRSLFDLKIKSIRGTLIQPRNVAISVLVLFAFVSLLPRAAEAASSSPHIVSLSPRSGLEREPMTIRGRSFGAQPGKVLFNGRSARVQRWSATSIVVTIPTGNGSAVVKVVRKDKKKSNGKPFTYQPIQRVGTVKVFAVNDLGMHCVDQDYSVLSMLPPFNVVNAQIVGQTSSGAPVILDATSVDVRYSAVVDPTGSINSSSIGKTNFWTYVFQLFGVNLPLGQGLTGLYMPGDAPSDAERTLSWSSSKGQFSAAGIPIVPIDNRGTVNRYPLMRISAFDKRSGGLVGSTDIVLPVSEETTCVSCHVTGARATSRAGVTWFSSTDKEREARENILLLHDAVAGTTLTSRKPVLCASCHYSPALDLAGAGPNAEQQLHRTMSAAMHAHHQDKMIDPVGTPYADAATPRGGTPSDATRQACYQCHPGANTKCLRGAMTDTLSCQNCHGGMHAVGGESPLRTGGSLNGDNDGGRRRPWVDLPRCQSCHTGDALDHIQPSSADQLALDTIRLIIAYEPSDPAASPRRSPTSRFAEETGKLFRHSKGHGGIGCEGCHGSTHAIWPNGDANANDNIAATELQGHTGTIAECSSCHAEKPLALTMKGPHGLHNVNDSRWVNGGHGRFYEKSAASCKACHGVDLRGSPLSKAAADRSFRGEDIGTVSFRKGDLIGCYSCHNGPGGGD